MLVNTSENLNVTAKEQSSNGEDVSYSKKDLLSYAYPWDFRISQEESKSTKLSSEELISDDSVGEAVEEAV